MSKYRLIGNATVLMTAEFNLFTGPCFEHGLNGNLAVFVVTGLCIAIYGHMVIPLHAALLVDAFMIVCLQCRLTESQTAVHLPTFCIDVKNGSLTIMYDCD